MRNVDQCQVSVKQVFQQRLVMASSPASEPHTVNRKKRPRFQELPLHPSHPPLSAWGVWGAEDQLGCLNLLTTERVVAASRMVQAGVSVGLNWELGQMKVPPFYRTKLKLEIFSIGENVNVTLNIDTSLIYNLIWQGLGRPNGKLRVRATIPITREDKMT